MDEIPTEQCDVMGTLKEMGWERENPRSQSIWTRAGSVEPGYEKPAKEK